MYSVVCLIRFAFVWFVRIVEFEVKVGGRIRVGFVVGFKEARK